MSSAKCAPFCSSLNVLNIVFILHAGVSHYYILLPKKMQIIYFLFIPWYIIVFTFLYPVDKWGKSVSCKKAI